MNAIELRDDVRRSLIDYGSIILKDKGNQYELIDPVTFNDKYYIGSGGVFHWDEINHNFYKKNNWYKEKDMLEELKKELGQIRATQGVVDNLKSRFEVTEKKVIELSERMSKYVECEATGLLINRDMAQSFSVLSSDYVPRRYQRKSSRMFFDMSVMEYLYPSNKATENVTAYTVYLSNIVDMKKFKKDNKIK